MEQLIIHLISDFWLQNDWMALNKKKNFWIALLHSFIYAIPFVLLTHSISALFVIFITHALIDGTNIINKLNQIKNCNFKTLTGYGENRPDWISIWLIIIQDNSIHLLINYLSIKYL
jgi:hypothetical protein